MSYLATKSHIQHLQRTHPPIKIMRTDDTVLEYRGQQIERWLAGKLERWVGVLHKPTTIEMHLYEKQPATTSKGCNV